MGSTLGKFFDLFGANIRVTLLAKAKREALA